MLIGGNYYPEPTGIGKYNGEMMKWLAEEGHDCTVVTTFPYYPEWKVQPPYQKKCYWFKKEIIQINDDVSIKIIRCPHYVPGRLSGFTRSLSEFSFFFSSCLIILQLLFKKKYNTIITVAPPFALGLLGLLYKKIRGGNFLYHIQDLQIDAARDLSMIKSGVIINIFLAAERFIIKHADVVSTISQGMINKCKDKCDKEVVLFPNWVDTQRFRPLNTKEQIKASYGFSPTDKIILYAGAIGQKQGLEAVLYCAKTLESSKEIKFAICGTGPYKEKLVELKNQLKLENVFFLPLQPLKVFNSFLNMADAHLVLQRAGASDLVLPSKLSAILSVGGVPIVTANEGTTLHDIVNYNNMGIVIEPENQQSLADAIANINIENPEYQQKSRNAREYAEAYLTGKKILNRYFSKVFDNRNAKSKITFKKTTSRSFESI